MYFVESDCTVSGASVYFPDGVTFGDILWMSVRFYTSGGYGVFTVFKITKDATTMQVIGHEGFDRTWSYNFPLSSDTSIDGSKYSGYPSLTTAYKWGVLIV